MDGGALTNQGVHHLDLLRYFLGEPKEVYGKKQTFGADIEVEDTFIGVCQFSSQNIIASIEVTTAARPKDFCAEISIVGSKGLAQIGGIAVNELQLYTPQPSDCELFSEDFSDCVYGNGHARLYSEISSFYKDKEQKKRNYYSISVQDAFSTIEFLDACYRAMEQEKNVLVSSDEESLKLGRKDRELSNYYKLT